MQAPAASLTAGRPSSTHGRRLEQRAAQLEPRHDGETSMGGAWQQTAVRRGEQAGGGGQALERATVSCGELENAAGGTAPDGDGAISANVAAKQASGWQLCSCGAGCCAGGAHGRAVDKAAGCGMWNQKRIRNAAFWQTADSIATSSTGRQLAACGKLQAAMPAAAPPQPASPVSPLCWPLCRPGCMPPCLTHVCCSLWPPFLQLYRFLVRRTESDFNKVRTKGEWGNRRKQGPPSSLLCSVVACTVRVCWLEPGAAAARLTTPSLPCSPVCRWCCAACSCPRPTARRCPCPSSPSSWRAR